jgi:hypothetical protein
MIGPGQQEDWTDYPYKKNSEFPKGKPKPGKNHAKLLGIAKPGVLKIPKP